MAASSVPLQFDAIRKPFLQNRSFLRKSPSTLLSPRPTSGTSSVLTPSAKFDLSEMLGGRGLCNGELGLEKELEKPFIGEPEAAGDPPLPSSSFNIGGEESFEKELLGLTGGFPGGEKGLQSFIEKNPPPSKKIGDGEELLGALLQGSRPKPPDLPLLMPGMIVIVKNPANPSTCTVASCRGSQMGRPESSLKVGIGTSSSLSGFMSLRGERKDRPW